MNKSIENSVENKQIITEDYNLRKKIQQERLNNVLKNAINNVPAYFKYRNNENLTGENLLHRFAPIDKKAILKDYENYVSDLVDENNCFITKTSGSSGVPFCTIHNNEAQIEELTRILHTLDSNGIKDNAKILRICGKVNSNDIQTINEDPKIDIVYFDINGLLDDFEISILNKIDSFAPNIISGHGSEIILFYKLLQKYNYQNLVNNISLILCGGESLSAKTQEYLETSFKTKVIDLYGMQEIGEIAIQCSENKESYHIYEESIYLELEDKDGNISDEINNGELVITGLINEYMPLIRYKTGDVGIVYNSCKCGHRGKTIRILDGRKVNPIVLKNGDLLNPYILKRNLEKHELLCYQIIQNKLGVLDVKIVKNGDSINDLNYFKEIIMTIANNNLELNVSFNNIEELQGENGKIKSFLCNVDSY